MEKVEIYDTTLRDGEQSPGCSLKEHEKVQVAQQLERLNVDVIEAGFPAASPDDFKAVQHISKIIKNSTVTGLARSKKSDIDAAWEALKQTENPRVHVFIATSPVHMTYKLCMKSEEVLEMAAASVRYARRFFPQVEFSCEDATRSDYAFMSRVVRAAIKAGAAIINLPDTVGYCSPQEYAAMFHYVKKQVPDIDKVRLSCHCHNDLGMATANTLSSVDAGVRQIECTVNGVGERAGNVALEEIGVALHIRHNYYKVKTQLKLNEIAKTSRMVSQLMNSPISATKPIVGANAFAHEAGIHQDGVLKNPKTYEIISPNLVGLDSGTLVLGKHSGRHAFRKKAVEMGVHLTDKQIDQSFHEFKNLADQKKELTDHDFRTIFSKYEKTMVH
ncbi:2-isopropylmalate synthase [Sporolactobacillus shoreicorticis]|uniref:2-isopropylmalate synthase n=1 Tax=Sporolactobacillus shoreicorticis TaxID=1923877 RepID=A0ABW5S7F6_9BACL|nr:2-isopropylmalate synthase [Sporolactobacillus shoreicorticis]MCO7126857.1 2-isopropylmalate synthase [Sporolactobacillus shoreicorticis]